MFKEFDTYQHRAMATAAVRQKNRAGKAWAALEFSSEALELAALITSGVTKGQFRPKGKPEAEFVARLKDELGDALWTLSALAYMFDLSLAKIAKENLEKVRGKHSTLKTTTSKPADPFPWVKNKKAVTACPSCHGTELNRAEGCVTCVKCGWSVCG